MRHQRTGKKLGRDSSHRRALYANLTAELIEHERIKTTVTKAKAVRPIAEQMITLGRRGDMHARRQAVAFLGSKDIVHKLFDELGPRYSERPGGYSRIVRLGPRPGDSAEWCTSSSSTRRSSSSRGCRRRVRRPRPPPRRSSRRRLRSTRRGLRCRRPSRRARGPNPGPGRRVPEAEASAVEAEAPADEAEPAPEAEEGEGEDPPPAKS